MWIINSSIGRKLLMSISGLGLLGFVLAHGTLNFVYLIDPLAYNWIAGSLLGANWWAIAATMGLRAMFALHILLALLLTLQNWRARGTDRYAVSKRPKGVTWQSMNMLLIGIILMGFLGLHIYHFLIRMQIAEIGVYFFNADKYAAFLGIPGAYYSVAADGSFWVNHWFSKWYICVLYLIFIGALWLHITHGMWSGMHSLGLSNNKWLPRIKVLSYIIGSLACLLFAAIPIVYLISMIFGIEPTFLNFPQLFRMEG